MPYLEWSAEYETGIPLIDGDHQTLFATVNMLHDWDAEGKNHETLARAIDVLVMYVDRHFAREEALMESHGYPDLVAHMAKHRRITEQVHGFRTAFEENPDSLEMEPFLEFVRDWLTNHILKTDMEYVPHIQEDMKD